MQVADAVYAAKTDRPGKSDLFAEVMAFPADLRRDLITSLDDRDLIQLFALAEREAGTAYAVFVDDPVGFTEIVLGMSLWSTQQKIAESVRDYRRTAVPSCVGVGKTFAAGAMALWWGSVHPVGTSLAVTIATRFRQVQRQMWPAIRQMHAAAQLPGECDMTQWKIPDLNGVDTVVGYGFSPPDYDEAALQGIHSPNLLLVTDEAGGIAQTVGDSSRSMLTGEGTHLLAIGNPPTDNENSWFEQLCEAEGVSVIRIDMLQTPNFTGERTGQCGLCPSGVPKHRISRHLTDRQWETDARNDHGSDSPYYQAKVRAKFPRGGSARALPGSWLDNAVELAGVASGDLESLAVSVDVASGRPYRRQPSAGAWIRLGVDVAADGGDELVVARCEGDVVRIMHTSSGETNQNAVDVAGKVLEQIRAAELLRQQLGTSAPVRVKVDGIGVGWGVCSTLDAWGAEGIHDAEIVPVIVSERVEKGRENPPSTLRPTNKRAEMWLAMRSLIQPDRLTSMSRLALDIDAKTRAQLGAPLYGTSADGTTFIESKKSIKKRGLSSPDRAEAALLAVYEPHAVVKRKRRMIITGA